MNEEPSSSDYVEMMNERSVGPLALYICEQVIQGWLGAQVRRNVRIVGLGASAARRATWQQDQGQTGQDPGGGGNRRALEVG
jgi:hypothetical protein